MLSDITPEIQERAVKYLDVLENAVKATTDFASDQVPLVVQELILWARVASMIDLLFTVILFVVSVFSLVKAWQWNKKHHQTIGSDKYWDSPYVLTLLPPALLTIGFFIATGNTALTCAKTWCAPRLVVLEEVQKLVSK